MSEWKEAKLTDEQIEKIIRAWSKNLNNTIDGFGHNVNIQALKVLRKILIDAIEKIDRVIELLEGKQP